MPGFATDLAADLSDYVLGGEVPALVPATWYVGYSTTAPNADGSNFTEPVGNGYARVAVTNNLTNFPATGTRTKSNGTAVAFPPTTGSQGSVSYAGLFLAASGGTPKLIGTIAGAPVAIGGSVVPTFAVGAITFTLPW